MRVLGVDGCPGGWVGVVPSEALARCAPTLSELVTRCGPVDCVAVDIPLGLPDTTRRQADTLVRRLLGPRRSSVFDAAVPAAYQASSHAAGSAAHRAATGRGLSAQAWHLGPRVLDARAFALGGSHAVIEAHPELSFSVMGAGPLPSKKTPLGAAARRSLLASVGIAVPDVPGPAQAADVLDACAVAWTAERHLAGRASSYPSPPEVFSDGLPAAIWA